ncbi:MAG: hypothetical protein IPL94_12640 [Tetrasphaera sp.]|jgi:hypothetical protein|nr:hypothetical protein [Tetrasphaera sp.]
MPSRSRLAKILGLGALAGLVATGTVAARGLRPTGTYTPSEVTTRLRERYRQALDRARDAEAGVAGSE